MKETNIMKLSDEEHAAFEEKCQALYENNHPLFEAAERVVEKLSLGGLWRGYAAAVVIVADALREARESSITNPTEAK